MTTEPGPPAGAWRPTANRQRLQARARLLADVRDFFTRRGVLEVETPTLSAAGNSDPGIAQLRTDDARWLRTSPEYPMKRLLAAGSGDIYELGRVFRAGEAGAWHNLEFTLLEWYRVGWRFDQLMDEVAEFIAHCGDPRGRRWRVRKVHYRDWVQAGAGVDPLAADADAIRHAIASRGIDAPLRDLDRDGLLDLLVSHVVQPAMSEDTLTLVSHYPASQAALARLCDDNPQVAERFEAFLGPVELANGYGELTDAREQRRRFETENRRRAAEGRHPALLDEALLEALEHGMPDCAGVALGLDRLLMVLEGVGRIEDVLAFPASRA